MARRRGKTVEVYVNFNDLNYGFRTQKTTHESYKAELGQTAYGGKAGVFFGANSPKPPRATKEFEGGSVSSFCSSNKIATLEKADWEVNAKGSFRGLQLSGKTRTVYIDMPDNWKYAWNITAAEVALAGTLGFKLATGADVTSLVWGVQSPKPPRARKREGGTTTSTFIEPKASTMQKAFEEGYKVSNVNYDLLPEA